jgi:3-oxoacyl-[acyl-carrier protein] reductase
MGVEKRVALITGAGCGIGAAIAKALARAGAVVAVNYRQDRERAAATIREIEAAGGTALAAQADVTAPEDVHRLVDRINRELGGVDILVNNAHNDFTPKPFLELRWDDLQRQVDGTIRSVFLCAQSVLPAMLAQKWGRIINIGSVSADQPEPGFLARDTVKAALFGFTRDLALETAPAGVTVNLLSPGWTETNQAAGFPDAMKDRALTRTPVGRLAIPDDIANAAVFLATEESRFITGICLRVCGGAVML